MHQNTPVDVQRGHRRPRSGARPTADLDARLYEALAARTALAERLRATHAALAGLHAGDPVHEARLHQDWASRQSLDAELGALVGRWLDQGGQITAWSGIPEAAPSPPEPPRALPELIRTLKETMTAGDSRAARDVVLQAEALAPASRPVVAPGSPPSIEALGDPGASEAILQPATTLSSPGALTSATAPPPTLQAEPTTPAPPAATPPAPPLPMGPPASLQDLERLAQVGIGGAATPKQAANAALPQDLRRIATTLPDPELLPVQDALDALQQAVEQRTLWNGWPKATQRTILAAVVCTARAIQQRTDHQTDLTPVFGKLGAWSKEQWPGPVHGLALYHKPHGAAWADDARKHQAALRDLAGLATPRAKVASLNPEVQLERIKALLDASRDGAALRSLLVESLTVLDATDPRLTRLLLDHQPKLKGERQLKALRAAVRKAGSARQAQAARKARPDGYPEADWPHWEQTRGRTAFIVGGAERTAAKDRVSEAFGFHEVTWIDPVDHKKVESLATSVRKHNVGVVILLRSFCPHAVDEKLVPACKESGTPWVSVDKGYGVSQVRTAMERFWASR